MIIQIDNQAELDALSKHIADIPSCEPPCLVYADDTRPTRCYPLDIGLLGRVSVSVAIDRLRENELYEELRKLSPARREQLIKRLDGMVL